MSELVIREQAKPGAAAQGSPSPERIAVTFDNDAGGGSTVRDAGPGDRRSAIFERMQKQIDEGSTIATATDQSAPVEEAPAEGDAAEPVEAAPDGSEAAPADPAPETDKPTDPAPAAPTSFALTQAQLDLETARRELADARNGKRSTDFATFFEKPVDSLRAWIADTLGLKPDAPEVAEEMLALHSELTWDVVDAKDLPAETKDQLSRDRLNRKIRLDSHRRQSDQRASQGSSQEQRARELATSVYDTVKATVPGVPLAERIFRRPAGELIVDALVAGAQSGRIVDVDKKSDTELFTEATRLINEHAREWAKELAPLIATLIPQAAPTAPGVATPNAGQSTVSPQAAPQASDKPRTLPAAKVGAAPSRPAVQAKKPEALSLDPETRRQQIIARHSK